MPQSSGQPICGCLYLFLCVVFQLLCLPQCTRAACSCCLRMLDACACKHVRFGHFPTECGKSMTNIKFLLQRPYVYVEQPSELPPGPFTVLVLDINALKPPARWSQFYLITVGWNIHRDCLLNEDGCALKTFLSAETAPCNDSYTRHDPVRIVLLRQKRIFGRRFFNFTTDRIFAYRDLYHSALFYRPPVRMSEYVLRYCVHHSIYDDLLMMNKVQALQLGCNFDKVKTGQLRTALLNEFPQLAIKQSDVNEELQDCYILKDYQEKPRKPRTETRARRRTCPLNLMAIIRQIKEQMPNVSAFTNHLLARIDDWIWLTKIEYMHLMKIKHSSDILTNGPADYDIHRDFCNVFRSQLKKTNFCAVRAEAYRQVLAELGVKWTPDKT